MLKTAPTVGCFGFKKVKKGMFHLYSTVFVHTAFRSAITDTATVQPRPKQARDFDLCCHKAAHSPSLPLKWSRQST